MRAAATTSPGSGFKNFLYAPICQDQEGLALTVLSALARQDVDPWTEAARLSQLPNVTATKQIADLLDGLPRRSLAYLDRVEVASRLSALLPRTAAVKVSGMLKSFSTAKRNPTTFAFNWQLSCLYLCLILMNWLMAEFRAQTAAGTRPSAVTKAPVTRSTSGEDTTNQSI